MVDVEGMYPAMPKPVIRVAMRELLNLIKAKLPPGSGKDPKVRVPKRGKGVCTWAHTARGEQLPEIKARFRAGRFMDDILMVVS